MSNILSFIFFPFTDIFKLNERVDVGNTILVQEQGLSMKCVVGYTLYYNNDNNSNNNIVVIR